MTTRTLLAALLGFSLAAGTLGSASAQTATPVAPQSVSPSDTVAPTTAVKTDTMKKAPVRKGHHARMTTKAHRKHVSLRTTKKAKIAGQHVGAKHVASKSLPGKVSATLIGKRIRISHALKRGTIKHV